MINKILNSISWNSVSDEDNIPLFLKALSGSEDEKWDFVFKNASLISKIIWGDFSSRYNDIDACFSDGLFGFYTALSRFKLDPDIPSVNNIRKFIRYSRFYIKFYILDNIKKRGSQLSIPATKITSENIEELSMDSELGPQPSIISDTYGSHDETNNDCILNIIDKLNENQDPSLHLTEKQNIIIKSLINNNWDLFKASKEINLHSPLIYQHCHLISRKISKYASVDYEFKKTLLRLASNMSIKFYKYLISEIETNEIKTHKESKDKNIMPQEIRNKISKTCKGLKINIKTYRVLDPQGKEHIIDIGMENFCKLHKLCSRCMLKVVKGKFKQHNGWTAPDANYVSKRKTNTYKMISPDGKEIIIDYGLKQFCNENKLQYNAALAVINGRKKHHKGWTATV